MSSEQQSVSKLGLASVFLRTLFAVSTRLWVSPFKRKGAPTYFRDVAYAAFRSHLGNLSLAQERYISNPTTSAYLSFAKASGIAPDSITLSDGTQAHWIGNKHADKTIVYFHGGGYVMPATPGIFQFLTELSVSMKAGGVEIGIIIPAYTLAPEATYPTQLKQAIALLRYLLEVEKRSPENMILGGDSAGGNLTLAVLSHLKQPHSSVPKLELSASFHAAFLLSPWVSFDYTYSSFKTNAERDIFNSKALKRWSDAFLGSNPSDFYSEPNLAPAEWWSGVEKYVKEVLIWGGGYEILIEGIREFSRKFEKGFGGKIVSIETAEAGHEEMILDKLLGYKAKGEGAKVVESWVQAKL